MAAAAVDGDAHRFSPPPETAASSTSPHSTAQSPRSLHQALGGGAVADLLLWRRRNITALALAVGTAYWFIFERAGYSVLSLTANAVLILITILFFWAKSASLFNRFAFRPLPPLPSLEISDEAVRRAAAQAHVWVSLASSVAGNITVKRDRKVFLEVILVLWLVSYVGGFFSFLMLVYVGFILCLTVPALYEKYQDLVDEKLGIVYCLVLKQYDNIVNKSTRQDTKEKKTQ